jgi:formylglycine-generating enzyme required for sulfatase activity
VNLRRRLFVALNVVAVLCARMLAGETATAEAALTAGFVTAITVTSGGSGYITEPVVTLSGGGGSGSSATAILAEGKVATIIVLAAGGGYSTVPKVVIEAPPKVSGVRLNMVAAFKGPQLTVEGLIGTTAKVEWADHIDGPWNQWTNVAFSSAGVVLVDLSPVSSERFFRAISAVNPIDPSGPSDPNGRNGPKGFVWIPPGTFVMGSPLSEAYRQEEEVQHPVILTQGFWMSDHEVTQAEYEAVIGSNPSFYQWERFRDRGLAGRGSSLPVDSVCWYDAMSYCQKLTERERAAGRITAKQAYRLPTEAEWEYAARAGTTGPRYGLLDDIGWWEENNDWTDFIYTTHEVGGKRANAWGLFDMIGNVVEWCSDWAGSYPTGSVTDPTGPIQGSYRVYRGGGFAEDAGQNRSASRSWAKPSFWTPNHGFRPVLSSVR